MSKKKSYLDQKAAATKKANELKQHNNELRAFELEEEKRKQEISRAQAAEIEASQKKSYTITPTPGVHELTPLIKAYIDEIKKEPERRPDGSSVLVFDGLQQANDFFTKRAKEKICFLCVEENKGFAGHNFYSCGDGNIYQGSLDDIIAGLKQSIAADASNKEAQAGLSYISSLLPKPNPATAFRNVLGDKNTLTPLAQTDDQKVVPGSASQAKK